MKNEGKLGRWKTHQTYGKDTTSEIRWATKYTERAEFGKRNSINDN